VGLQLQADAPAFFKNISYAQKFQEAHLLKGTLTRNDEAHWEQGVELTKIDDTVYDVNKYSQSH